MFWKQLFDLFKQSVIVQALVTLALIVTCCVRWAQGLPLDPDLVKLTVLVVGFWFGSKVGYQQGQNEAGSK